MFASMYVAYDTLSPKLKSLVDPLIGVHDISLGRAYHRIQPDAQAEMMRLNPPIAHPIVQIHPETGRKALYVGSRIRNFVGMTEEESQPLIRYLNEHATRYEFIYRHRWTLHDLLIWDNRCALHYAVGDFDRGQLRQMQRCSLLGPQKGQFLTDTVPVHAGVVSS